MGISKYNAERYPDPTAYQAIMKAERSKAGKGNGNMKLVYICSRYAGDVGANVAAAIRYCRFAIAEGYMPFAPHLLYPQVLDDDDPSERALGLKFGCLMLDRCREVWVFGGTVSLGMRGEIERAKKRGITLRYFTEECREVRSPDNG